MPQNPRRPLEITRDILAAFRREIITLTTIYMRANLNHNSHQAKYIDPLVEYGFITVEEKGKRRYPIKLHTLTPKGQWLLFALGGKP